MSEKTKGMKLPCPMCGVQEAPIAVDLDDGETFHCRDCDSEFTTDDVRNLIKKWTIILKWLETLPGEEE